MCFSVDSPDSLGMVQQFKKKQQQKENYKQKTIVLFFFINDYIFI